ncbi:MAG: SurA N-terminal domain-containing protein [Rickettsia sp.]|nr:SurA N-terminal domain-containing protein [Rickettsia sp.]
MQKNFIIKICLLVFLGIFIVSQFMIGSVQKKDEIASFDRASAVSIKDFQDHLMFQVDNIENYLKKKLTRKEIEELGLMKYVLDDLTHKSLLHKFSEDLKLQFSEDYLIKQMKKIPAFLNKENVFDISLFQKILENQGKNESDFLNIIDKNLKCQTVVSLISKPLFFPDMLVKNTSLAMLESRIVDVFSLDLNQKIFPDFVFGEYSQEDLKKFYNSHKDNFLLKERRSVNYIVLPRKRSEFKITDKMISDYYYSNQEDFLDKKLEDVKKDIKSILDKQFVDIYQDDFFENLRSEIFDLPEEQQNIDFLSNKYSLAKQNIASKTFEEFSVDQNPMIRNLTEQIFELESENVINTIDLKDKIVIFEIYDIKRENYKNFDDVEQEILDNFKKNFLINFNLNRFKQIHSKNLEDQIWIKNLNVDKNVKLFRIYKDTDNKDLLKYPKELVREIFSVYDANQYTKIIKKSSYVYFAHVRSIQYDNTHQEQFNYNDLSKNIESLFNQALLEELMTILTKQDNIIFNYKAMQKVLDQYS